MVEDLSKYTSPNSFPHCDSHVLHAPALNCWACNLYPELQAERVRDQINFTGEYDLGKLPCPSEEARDLATIERWPGNVARTAAEVGLA